MKLNALAGTLCLLSSHVFAADMPLQDALQQGRAYFNDAKYSAALATLEKSAPTQKSSGEFNYYHGLSLLKTDQSESAIGVMKRAIELEPNNADYRFALGLIYATRMAEVSLLRAAMMIGSAKAALVAAVELDPNHVGATMALAEFLLDVPSIGGRNQDQAQNLLSKLRILDAASAAALEAKMEVRSGNFERAEKLLLQAVNTPGSEPVFRLRLAKLYLDQRAHSKAIAYGTEYLAMPKHWKDFSRDTSYANLWLAIAFHALGDNINSRLHSRAVNTTGMPQELKHEVERIRKSAASTL